ncbi:hypothetical protein AAHA92_21256 [Salvia divinorum]|uniref:Uncharacterized protein n=1 Tax=Salvia divinorum TaxID=28513 RepID=A0ABD1GJU9_SALDI
MELRLTQLEMDAVVQLLQLSSGDSAADCHLLWVEIKRQVEREENREESVGEASSSSAINPEKLLEEALPRRKKRVLPIADIYRKTAPLINNRTLKRSKI